MTLPSWFLFAKSAVVTPPRVYTALVTMRDGVITITHMVLVNT